MMMGTSLELFLLHHYEGVFQLIPLILIASAILLVVVTLVKRSFIFMLSLKTILVLIACSGILGTFLHLKANYEFEIEMTPTATTWGLFMESLSGALPALAPSSLLVMALIGYIYIKLINQKQ